MKVNNKFNTVMSVILRKKDISYTNFLDECWNLGFSNTDICKVLFDFSQEIMFGGNRNTFFFDGERHSKIRSEQLKMGIREELEHTSLEFVAKKIAMDHLLEDPDYYTKLKKAME